jgi:hypothetical protein
MLALGPNGEVAAIDPDTGRAYPYLGPELPPAYVTSKESAWVDCPVHGPTPPVFITRHDYTGFGRYVLVTRINPLRERVPPRDHRGFPSESLQGPHEPARAACARCPLGDPATNTPALLYPLRRVKLRQDRSTSNPEQCGGACLNGKRSCNCQCKGQCHGAGRCGCRGA